MLVVARHASTERGFCGELTLAPPAQEDKNHYKNDIGKESDE